MKSVVSPKQIENINGLADSECALGDRSAACCACPLFLRCR